MILALIIGACRGTPFLLISLKGMAMGAGIGMVPFTLHMLGGGDVKSLMALGAFAGPDLTWSCFIAALMAGGVFGVLPLLSSLPFSKHRSIPFTTLLAFACYLLLVIY